MRRLLPALVPVAVLAALLWSLGTGDVAARIRHVDPGWLAIAVACLIAQTFAMAFRWRLVAACLGSRMGAGHAVREYLVGQVVNLTLPGGVLGDAARAIRSRTRQGGLIVAAQAVAVERAAGQAGLLAVAVVGLVWASVVPGAVAVPNWGAFAAFGSAGTVAAAAFASRGGRLAALLHRCFPTMRIAAAQVALSLVAAILNVAAFAACARATGTALGVQTALLLVPLVLTAMLVPLSVGGWGWREGAAAALFPLAGQGAQAGIAASVAFGAAMLLAVLPVLPMLMRARAAERTG